MIQHIVPTLVHVDVVAVTTGALPPVIDEVSGFDDGRVGLGPFFEGVPNFRAPIFLITGPCPNVFPNGFLGLRNRGRAITNTGTVTIHSTCPLRILQLANTIHHPFNHFGLQLVSGAG